MFSLFYDYQTHLLAKKRGNGPPAPSGEFWYTFALALTINTYA